MAGPRYRRRRLHEGRAAEMREDLAQGIPRRREAHRSGERRRHRKCGQLQALVDKLAKAGAKVKEAAPDIDTARLHDLYIAAPRRDLGANAGSRHRGLEPGTRSASERLSGPVGRRRDMTPPPLAAAQERAPPDAAGVQRLLRRLRHCSARSPRRRRFRTITSTKASAGGGASPSTTSACRRPTSCSGPAIRDLCICRRRSGRPASRRRGCRSAIRRSRTGRGQDSIAFARLVEKAFGGFEPPKGYD